MSKRVVEWELGGRDDRTLRKLLDKISINNRIFIIDDWEGYHRCIPANQNFTGKDLTYPIEQDNSNTCHYLARFRRQSKMTSRTLQMVDVSLRFLYHFLDPIFRAQFIGRFQAIFT